MLIRLVGGVATAGRTFDPGTLIRWEPDAEARRMVDAKLAVAVDTPPKGEEIRSYTSPPRRPDQVWPPAPPARKPRDRAALSED